jgi:hypothetical protein
MIKNKKNVDKKSNKGYNKKAGEGRGSSPAFARENPELDSRFD